MNLLCQLIGHRRQYRPRSYCRVNCRGVLVRRDGYSVSCARCGVGGPDCYERSRIERAIEWWERLKLDIRNSYDPPPSDDLPF